MPDIDQKELDILKRALDFEKSIDPGVFTLGWQYHDVGSYAGTIYKLVVKDLVKITLKTNSGTHYQLTDAGKALAEGGELVEEVLEEEVQAELVAPLGDMFSDIVGYDDVKELLRESLQLEKAIHVLLHGPPSISKSKFLLDIEQAAGALALPLLGSATSHAGLWDLIAERRPKYLLIDEIEKLPIADMAGLLSLMEQGRIIRAKVGRKLDIKLDIRVLAAANRITKLPPELLSRFAKFHLTEYSASEYITVVENVLMHQEGLSEDNAHGIAFRLVGKTHDIRDAIRVGRLSTRVGVKRAVELLIRPEEDRG